MNVSTSPLGPTTRNPWLTACIALFVGLLAGLISPQNDRERAFMRPFALRVKADLANGLRALFDRTLATAFGQR